MINLTCGPGHRLSRIGAAGWRPKPRSADGDSHGAAVTTVRSKNTPDQARGFGHAAEVPGSNASVYLVAHGWWWMTAAIAGNLRRRTENSITHSAEDMGN